MREIKFKAKRVDDGVWVYGYFFKSWDNCYILHGTVNGVPVMVEVIPETVCQWTGLLDKHGIKIFEGDILKTDDGDIVEVRYEKIYASFGIWKKGWAFLHYFHEAVDPEDCEVIGNIHDKNKEQ